MVALGVLLGTPTAVYITKVLDSGYQPRDMHCIVLTVKFDGGLSISVLRNKQLLKKKEVNSSHFLEVQIFFIFQIPPFEKRAEKSHFFKSHFSC
jgi:hypothetical protein